MKTDPSDFTKWPPIRSVMLRIPTQQTRRDDGCKCCSERMSYHVSGSSPTTGPGPQKKAITRIHPHLVTHEKGIHLSIFLPSDSGGEVLWHTVRYKDAIKVEFDTKGGENG